MKIAFFSAKSYEKTYFIGANKQFEHELMFIDTALNLDTASLAKNCDAVCAFVNDTLDKPCIDCLFKLGIKVIALRSAGYNHVDIERCAELSIKVCYVPEYSPYSVAEHTFALLLTLNRKIHKAYLRVREGDFSLNHLMGHELHGKTIGIIGYGRIGRSVAQIAEGFGLRVKIYDPYIKPDAINNTKYHITSLDELLFDSHIISLHCPLNKETHHIINGASLLKMKPGTMLINTSRGGLIDHNALIQALKTQHIGAVGLDVYEQEKGVFFYDHAEDIINDDVLMRLMTFPNVLITSHQGFFTHEALTSIASTTLENLSLLEQALPCSNLVC